MRPIDVSEPIRRTRDWPRMEERQLGRLEMPAQTRPTPLLSGGDQAGTQGIPLDVPQDAQQVVVFLDGENSKAPLPDVTRDTILSQVARRMSRKKPMHKVADRVVGSWPESQVKVIAQQAKSYHADWKSRCSLRQEPHERLIISIAVEDLGAAVAPVNHVVSKAGWRRSSRAWHGAYRDRADGRLQGGISYVPISILCPH